MRIHLKVEGNGILVPFDHQPKLVGTIHKWMGWNDEHGKLSFYSFSKLEDGKATSKGLLFPNGTSFFFSSHSIDLIKKMITGIQSDPLLFEGLSVVEIVIQEDPDLKNRNHFFVASPIFIKRQVSDKVEHILYTDPKSGEYLEQTLQTKMKKAGIIDDTLSIKFDSTYHKASSKLVNYNGIKNRANWCPVIIVGKPETKLFAWNVGLGNSTGIGFGAIK